MKIAMDEIIIEDLRQTDKETERERDREKGERERAGLIWDGEVVSEGRNHL
jgi:hypothetical protein